MSKQELVIENLDPKIVFMRNGGLEPVLAMIEAEATSGVPDTSTTKGRKAIAKRAHKISKSKVLLDNMGKALSDRLPKQTKRVDIVRENACKFCDDLRDSVRLPLTEWEDNKKQKKSEVIKEVIKEVIEEKISTTQVVEDFKIEVEPDKKPAKKSSKKSSKNAKKELADKELADKELADKELADKELADKELADKELADKKASKKRSAKKSQDKKEAQKLALRVSVDHDVALELDSEFNQKRTLKLESDKVLRTEKLAKKRAEQVKNREDRKAAEEERAEKEFGDRNLKNQMESIRNAQLVSANTERATAISFWQSKQSSQIITSAPSITNSTNSTNSTIKEVYEEVSKDVDLVNSDKKKRQLALRNAGSIRKDIRLKLMRISGIDKELSMKIVIALTTGDIPHVQINYEENKL
jgi:colicin import membrane protein